MTHNPGAKMGLAVSTLALIAGAALAAPPPADTVIGNQAAATYVSDGERFTVQSNLVETRVNEVFDVTLGTSQTRKGAPGSLTSFPHTINNNGNTNDRFDLAVDPAGGTDDFALNGLEVFPDADQDGVADSLTPISETPSIPVGESFGVIVRATAPSAATTGQTSDFDLTATSRGDPDVSQTNTDAVEITSQGIIDLAKVQTLANDADGSGDISVGDTIAVTLTYSNTGIGAANDVVITDALPVENRAGETVALGYKTGSATWSDNAGTALSEASGDVEATNAQGTSLEYETTGNTTVTATLDTLAAGRSGSISFDYVILSAPQGAFENIATVETATQPQTDTNPSPITVAPTASLVLADGGANAPTPAAGVDGANLDTADLSSNDDDGNADDTVTRNDDVFAGQSMAFDFVATNLGNKTDAVALALDAGTFPAGTQFDLVSSDGITPLVGDALTLAPGARKHAQLIARLPATAAQTAAPAGFAAELTATSRSDGNVTNTTDIVFDGAVLNPPVDLEDTDGGGTVTGGNGNGAVRDGSDPWSRQTVEPGETAAIPMRVSVDAGAPANTFDLLASTDPGLAAPNLPEDWSVEFFANGRKVTSTGALAPTDTDPAVFEYEARVTVPASAEADPDGVELYFRAESPLNGAGDTILNAVGVAEIVDVALEADTTVQAAPGGVAVLSHTLTNAGNATVTAGAIELGATDPFTGQGMSASVFLDANDDGVLDASDPLVSDISEITGSDGLAGLSQGEQARLFVRAQVPATASLGIRETGDLTISSSLTTQNGAASDRDATNSTVEDTIIVISGDVVMRKLQAVDADCDATPETAFTPGQQTADPGACLIYRLVADNSGTSEATNVVISDTVPDFTTLETCPSQACSPTLVVDGVAGSVGIVPADETSGSVASSGQNAGFSLAPGSRAVLTFSVQIDE